VIELFEFQHRAVSEITGRFLHYIKNRPGKIVGTKTSYTPFYQALASITASGKTVIMAQLMSELLPLLPLRPIVIWISKGRVVVDQTYANLRDGGKYSHLLPEFQVRLLGEYDQSEVSDDALALVYIATVGTFNQKDRDAGRLKLFKSEIDNADEPTWNALKARTTSGGFRRPLLVVYDEAHNLTDQQTNLLMELDPDALLLASATPRLPPAIAKIVDDLKDALKWTDDDLTTYVSSKDVVEEGLVKRQILLGGYQAQMEETVQQLLADMGAADESVRDLGLSLRPKAIYVCRTNITEGNANLADDPKQPFEQRQAPPILIWKYLVIEQSVDPATIAVYTSALKFDKDYPPPAEFVQFRGGDSDYASFMGGNYRHVIFNLGLQEGWDDPECYFAYIDKSMQSRIQVEQIIGRVLRQPEAHHYEAEALNTAHFYVRVDAKSVFTEIVQEVTARLAAELPDVSIASYDGKKKNRPHLLEPKKNRAVPHVYRDPSAAKDPIDAVIRGMLDFRGDTGTNVTGRGARALVQQVVGSDAEPVVEWVERDHGNAVSARWIFQTAVRRVFPLALDVTRSDDPKYDARIELGSPADEVIRAAAHEVVRIYLERVVLKQRLHNPYTVGDILVDPATARSYKHALHAAYSGLNRTLELPFAQELDKLQVVWCRNPSRSGFGIPLLSPGQSKSFYPDFLVWKGGIVYALDTTGEHILEPKLARKLLSIEPHPRGKSRLLVRFVSRGHWNPKPEREAADGFTVWSLGQSQALHVVHSATIGEALRISLTLR
jgi:type III restriction enzyme